MPTDASRSGPSVLVGAVAQLYQGDLDFGRVVVDRLAADPPDGPVAVEDLSYGAVAVAQRLEELRPAGLVLVGAAARGRAPGTLERRRVRPLPLDRDAVQQAVAEAVTGYVTIDLLLEVGNGLGALPERTVTIELEPVTVEPSETLSSAGQAAVEPALQLVRAEARALVEQLERGQPLESTSSSSPRL